MSADDTPPSADRRPGRPPAGREPAARPGGGRPPGGPAGRPPVGGIDQQTMVGALLVGLAVVLGLVLLLKGFSDDGGTETASSTTSPEDNLDIEPSVNITDTSMTTTPLRDPAEIQVVVANAAGVAGAAGRIADVLEGGGYTILDTTNANASTDTVFYTGELQAEAEMLAAVLGLDASAVEEMPDPPPIDVGDADILVLIGPNLADAELPSGGDSGGSSGSSTTTSGGASTTSG